MFDHLESSALFYQVSTVPGSPYGSPLPYYNRNMYVRDTKGYYFLSLRRVSHWGLVVVVVADPWRIFTSKNRKSLCMCVGCVCTTWDPHPGFSCTNTRFDSKLLVIKSHTPKCNRVFVTIQIYCGPRQRHQRLFMGPLVNWRVYQSNESPLFTGSVRLIP